MESGTQTHTHGLTTSLFLTPLVLLDEGIGFCVWACFLLDGASGEPQGECVSAPVRPPCPGMTWTGMRVPVGTCYSRAQRTWAHICEEKPCKHQSPDTSTFWSEVKVCVPKSCSFLNIKEQIQFELKIVLLSAEKCWNKGLYYFLSCQAVP